MKNNIQAKARLGELIRIYQDLEKTLKELKKRYDKYEKLDARFAHLDLRKLIAQLSRSKKKLERKIGNTLLLEKQHLKRRIKVITDSFS
jgi:transposase